MVAAVIAAGCPVMPCRALSWCGAVADCPVVVRRVPRPLCVLDHQRAPLRNSSTTRAGSFFACILQIHCAWAYDGGSWRKRRTTSAFQPPTGHTLEATFVRDTGDAATRQAHANFLSTYHMTAEQMPLLSTRVAESCSLCRSCSRNNQTDMTRPRGRAGVAAQPTLLTEGSGPFRRTFETECGERGGTAI